MSRVIYKGPPRSDDERTFFDVMRGLLRVRKDELEEREKRWKAESQARRDGKVEKQVTEAADQAAPARRNRGVPRRST